jgi:SAM-dependent methyltransferase
MDLSGIYDEYAASYDLLYADKDYRKECDFVSGLLLDHGPVGSILELGSGTGRHAEIFVRQGFRIVGIDRSQSMLDQAERRRATLPPELMAAVRFVRADASHFCLPERFDAAVALFHSMCYLTTDEDLVSAMRAVRSHLHPGGLFFFDFWHGPGVVATPPSVRTKRVRDASQEIVRVATPAIHPAEHRVDVEYAMRVMDLATGQSVTFQEEHRVRYFFVSELESLLHLTGFAPVLTREWLTARPPGSNAWNACILARAVDA